MGVNGAGLIERPIAFSYDFRMCCDTCGQASTLGGDDYVRLNDEAGAHMDCDHCSASFHFGPLAVGIRDQDDLALDDSMINRLSWYHTSTYANLFSADFERDMRAAFSLGHARGHMSDPEALLQDQLNKALHLGTYEAAVENMYRRMRDQDDEASAFYLHRVCIDVAPGRVNPGYHNETDERAAAVSITEMTDLGLDTIRYVNVWESWGSISLAVRPHAITATQTIPVPAALDTSDDLPPGLLDVIEDLERAHKEPTDPEERRLHSYALTDELEEALIAYFLPGVNPVVARGFTGAVACAHGRGNGDYLGHVRLFAKHASMLSDSERVLRRLDAAPSCQHRPA
jgi:hypothetical protein